MGRRGRETPEKQKKGVSFKTSREGAAPRRRGSRGSDAGGTGRGDEGFGVALTRPLSCMLYCCGGKDAEEALGTAGSDVLRGRDEVPLSGYDMCGVAEMPELIPPTPSFHPSQTPTEYRPGSTHRRPPKLGQIGRSKRVVIEDEDLDDIMNNNAPLPLQISHSPA